MQQAGLSVTADDRPLQIGVARQQLRRLYTRVYDQTYDSVTAETAPVVRDTLTKGLAEGINPKEMARRLTDEISKVQRKRAETMARTEVINSYSEATLDRYERAGVSGVSVSGEFETADDDRVCPICLELEGETYPIQAMREESFHFEPGEDDDDHLEGEYEVKPPVHPRCRCAILPVVG
jgi:SPP1 gp7 family putative phage head morphogenesis protein